MTVNVVATRAGRSWTTVLDGTRLQRLQREHGLSQEQLADRAAISLPKRG
jgi:DNA-binding XRE family transcriptional regulator